MQNVAREVRSSRVLSREAPGIAGENIELARHFIEHDADLAVVYDLIKGAMTANKIRISLRQTFLAGRVDQQVQHQIGKFVAGRAFDWPVFAQRLVPGENLFDDQVKRSWRLLPQPLKILLGVEQTIDVIDPQSVEQSFAKQFEHKVVGVIEELRQLHS